MFYIKKNWVWLNMSWAKLKRSGLIWSVLTCFLVVYTELYSPPWPSMCLRPWSWTKDWRTCKCIFEYHAKLLVDAIHGDKGKSYFDTIVEDCHELLKHFEEVLVAFVYRDLRIEWLI